MNRNIAATLTVTLVSGALLCAQGLLIYHEDTGGAPILSHQLLEGDAALRHMQRWQLASRGLKDLAFSALQCGVWSWWGWQMRHLFQKGITSVTTALRSSAPAALTPPPLPLVALTAMMMLSSCMRPYDKAKYEEIKPHETAFLVPLEASGDKDQAKFDSESYLASHKVAAKRVRIPHRWEQTARDLNTGHWIPSHQLIRVDRSPLTREWTASSQTGTSTRNEAIWIESRDSVGFTMGFSLTAYVMEQDAARFLYLSPNGTLAQLLDNEARARIQQVASEVAAKYDLDLLRGKKQEIIDQVRSDMIPFFKDRGVTITTVAMFGGMIYENPEIQKAIDSTVIAQQQKVVAQAVFEAQAKKNETIELEARAMASAARQKAEAESDAKAKAILTEAEAEAKATLARSQAEAEAMMAMNKAMTNTEKPELMIALRTIEAQQELVKRWSGQFPTTYFGSATPQQMLLQLPSAQGVK